MLFAKMLWRLAVRDEIVRSRFPADCNPSAPSLETWLGFLHGLLYEDDIPTLQAYIGSCLIARIMASA